MFPRTYFCSAYFAPRYWSQSNPYGGLPAVAFTVNFVTVLSFPVNFVVG